MSIFRLRYVGVVITLSTISHTIGAAGFASQEKSVVAMGRAYAGNSLPADDASAAFYNPADMVNITANTHIQVGATYVVTDIELEGSLNTGLLSCSTCSGSAASDERAWIPNFNAVHRINDQLSTGLSITAPFGLATDYGDAWFGRYTSTLSEMAVMDINSSIAFKVSDDVSLGFGVSYQYVKAEINQKLHPSALAGFLFQTGAITAGQIPAFTSATEGDASLDGEDGSWGFNVGITWKITDAIKTSLAYRSEVSHTIDGTQQVSGYTAGGALASTLNTSTGGKADITMPEFFNISALFAVNDRWSVMTSAIYTGWSSFDELRVELDNGTTTVEPQEWNDVWAFAVGAAFKYSDQLDLRVGYQFDPTPITSSRYRAAKIPDTDRDFYSLGFSWHVNERMTIDGAYAYNHGESVDVRAGDDYTGSQGTFDARVKKSDAHLFGVQFQYYL